MFELFMYMYSCDALSARLFAVDRALNFYFMKCDLYENTVNITHNAMILQHIYVLEK